MGLQVFPSSSGGDISSSLIAAKGDLIVGTANDTVSILSAASTAGYTIVADSVEATGLKWAAPAGGGKVLQVVSATILTAATNSTNTYADSGLTASITPSVNTSKVLIMTSQQYAKTNGNLNNGVDTRLMRGASEIARISKDAMLTETAIYNIGTISYCFLDSPATTSSTTYKIQFRNDANAAAVAVSNNGVELQSMILMEIGA